MCHRDLKPENLLLDASGSIKLCDFGWAAVRQHAAAAKSPSCLTTLAGTPMYVAPEVWDSHMIAGAQYSGFTADVWSCGIILYAMLDGTLPFDVHGSQSKWQLAERIREGAFDDPKGRSAAARDLVRRILVPSPKERLTIEGIKRHAWFRASGADAPLDLGADF